MGFADPFCIYNEYGHVQIILNYLPWEMFQLISKHFIKIADWVFIVKLVSVECHRTSQKEVNIGSGFVLFRQASSHWLSQRLLTGSCWE